ncbi:MAG: organic solvent tolerance ABC transporter substrate-binding protein [Candidatus Rokuibacteriota bacterium]|nr:MAG: organic solvent tolerance ABC transporter substrate-binding protein [Candidatus Rokubacteria bacterium]
MVLMMTTTWTGIAISVAWLLVAEAAAASPAAGPREAVEEAVVRVLSIVQDGRADGAPVADRSGEIRRIAREMFDFVEISRRALSQHWQALTPEAQAEFVTLFRDLLERAYLAQIEAGGGERITFVGESIDGDSATVRSKVVTRRGTEIPLDYRLRAHGGRWRIYDVVVGGISFVESYRSQFDRVIRTESYDALRDRLQKRTLDTATAQRRPES